MLKYVDTKNAPAAIGPYSQGIILNGIAFFSGQIPLSPETGEVVGSDITEQAEQVNEECRRSSGEPGRIFHRCSQNNLLPRRTWLTSLHSTKYTLNTSQAIRHAPALL